MLSRAFRFIVIFLVFTVPSAAQLTKGALATEYCEPLRYFNPGGQEVVYQMNLPTPWWGIRMTANWKAKVDSAYFAFGITKLNSGLTPDTLDVRVLGNTLPQFTILDAFTVSILPMMNGTIPDAYYIVEFKWDTPVAWIDPPDDFWLTWRLKGPTSDIARIRMKTPALNPLRSVVVNSNGSTTLATDYVSSQIQDSVDLWAEARVCYPDGIPVELQSFIAAYKNGNAVLDWNTASELGNYGFEIERLAATDETGSLNIWQRIGFVQGHGTTTEAQQYSFIDPDPEVAMDNDAIVRYRLRQVDYDGSKTTSPVVALLIPNAIAGFELQQNYPNPVSTKHASTMIGFSLKERSNVRIEVFDALGRSVGLAADEVLDRGSHAIPFTVHGLPAGVYYYSLITAAGRLTRRMAIVE